MSCCRRNLSLYLSFHLIRFLPLILARSPIHFPTPAHFLVLCWPRCPVRFLVLCWPRCPAHFRFLCCLQFLILFLPQMRFPIHFLAFPTCPRSPVRFPAPIHPLSLTRFLIQFLSPVRYLFLPSHWYRPLQMPGAPLSHPCFRCPAVSRPEPPELLSALPHSSMWVVPKSQTTKLSEPALQAILFFFCSYFPFL